jgi:hypothetical protein
MKLSLKYITLVAFATTAPYPIGASAQSTTGSQPAKSPSALLTRSPEIWIEYDDKTYTPVVDAVGRHLAAARQALREKDNKKAVAELRLVVAELNVQYKAAVEMGKALAGTEDNTAQGAAKRITAAAVKVDEVASALEAGKISTPADLDKAIDSASRADMDRRWLVSDVTTWYPISAEPQHHFTHAIADYAKKDYTAAAADIRKAASYLRLEAGRAEGDSKQALDSSVAELDNLAVSVDHGAMSDEHSMSKAFARADHALALEHHANATEAWTDKQYQKAGYELKAAARSLEDAAASVGGEAKAAASVTVADTRALGDKLASGAHWTREEVANGLESLGNGIDEVGRKIAGTNTAAPATSGA